MNTGLINNENFSDVLRQLSQRRRQGMLELSFTDQKVAIAFHTGKIVEVYRNDISPVAELIEWLKSAQVVTPQFNPEHVTTYSQLFPLLGAASLPTARTMDEKAFKSLIRHRTMEKIFALPLQQGAIYSFAPELVEVDRDFSPSISVGQLLLDMVALESDDDNFEAVFSSDSVVRLSGNPAPANLSLDEKYLLELIGNGIEVESLSRKSLMSSYHFREALMSLLNSQLVVSTSAADQAPPAQSQDAPETRVTRGGHQAVLFPVDSEIHLKHKSTSKEDSGEETRQFDPTAHIAVPGAHGESGLVERRVALTPPSLNEAYEAPRPKRNRRLTDIFQRLNFSDDAPLEEDLPASSVDATSSDDSVSQTPTNRGRPRRGSGLFSAISALQREENPGSSKPDATNGTRTAPQQHREPSAQSLAQARQDYSASTNVLSGRASSPTAEIAAAGRKFASSPVVSLAIYWVFFVGAILIPLWSWSREFLTLE